MGVLRILNTKTVQLLSIGETKTHRPAEQFNLGIIVAMKIARTKLKDSLDFILFRNEF